MRWQAWLTETDLRLDDAPMGDPLHTKLDDGLDWWDRSERALRELHGFRGCIHGEGRRCPEAAAVRCSACAEQAGGQLRMG